MRTTELNETIATLDAELWALLRPAGAPEREAERAARDAAIDDIRTRLRALKAQRRETLTANTKPHIS